MRDLIETGNWTVEEQHPRLDLTLWEVEVRVAGVSILTIGHNHVAGVAEPELDRYADVIRNCAEHLKAFIGTGEPMPCFACGDTRQERWVGATGEEVGPCSICCEADGAPTELHSPKPEGDHGE